MIEWQPIFLSLKVAGVSLIFVFLFGVSFAHLLHNRSFPGKTALEAFFTLPLVLPPVVTGFLLLVLIGKNGPVGQLLRTTLNVQLVFTPYAAVLAAAVVAFPLMYQNAKAAFQNVDPTLEDAARTLGSSEWRVFLTVTLPLSRSGLMSGVVLSYARALGEFGATMMVAGNIPGKTQTIPLAIYFASEANDLTAAGIYVLIISVLTFMLLFLLNSWNNRKSIWGGF